MKSKCCFWKEAVRGTVYVVLVSLLYKMDSVLGGGWVITLGPRVKLMGAELTPDHDGHAAWAHNKSFLLKATKI